VLLANEQELSRRALHATIDAERARGDRLFAENEWLQTDLEQVKLEYIKRVRKGQDSLMWLIYESLRPRRFSCSVSRVSKPVMF